MKAYVLWDIGKMMQEEVDKPVPGPGEVLVKVKAAGICGSDIPRIYKTGAHVHPLIPGHEFSGEVVELGGQTDAGWLHKRVGIFPLIPCGSCEPCRNQQFELCENYNYLGSRCDGGFAEYVKVPEKNLLALPEQVSFEEAAMLEPMAVSVHAMRRVDIKAGDCVAVCGLGTIGLLLLMFLQERGITNILVLGNKEFQREKAKDLGIADENYCDTSKVDAGQWIQKATSGRGVDVFFECVGKNETVKTAIASTAAMGRVMFVGNPYSDMKLDKDIYWRILRKQLVLTGTWNSSFLHDREDDWNYVLEKLRNRRIAPARLISHRFSFADFEQGFLIMRDKKENYVKVMCVMD